MSTKKIIIILIISLLLSSIWLSYNETRQADLDYQKNWWVVYFENPSGSSLNFTIENHSKETAFNYKIMGDKNILEEKNISIKNNRQQKINIDPVAFENISERKITIIITDGNNKKEIYKILN
jgi:hypothetical protein